MFMVFHYFRGTFFFIQPLVCSMAVAAEPDGKKMKHSMLRGGAAEDALQRKCGSYSSDMQKTSVSSSMNERRHIYVDYQKAKGRK